jgi:protein-tyrosine phosphatase
MAGISRSATIVASHLIKKHRITPKDAIAHMAMVRPQVGPNSGFRIQLETLSSQVNK